MQPMSVVDLCTIYLYKYICSTNPPQHLLSLLSLPLHAQVCYAQITNPFAHQLITITPHCPPC